ncbi:DUF1700 domain-containing protein [Chitinolyticbacter meiyuanensis]|uniref:DUF1700 domain-containing protein n=1 Tax=Chitinolyticbacter meiyuanensis TaxID=682798 RepID=UPI0011E5EFDD|nr:DUF1700 domain-containing protein [Chitinolyticbacter meiyuanensis]
MTQHEFLQQLAAALAGLQQAQRDDILADYREYFREGLAEGRNETEIAAALGDPRELGRTLRVERSVAAWETRRSLPALWQVVLATASLGAVNLLLALPTLLWLLLLSGASLVAALIAGLGIVVLGSALFGNSGSVDAALERWLAPQARIAVSDGTDRILIQPDAAGRASVLIESGDDAVRLEGGRLLLRDGEAQFTLHGLAPSRTGSALFGLALLLLGGLALGLLLWLLRAAVRLLRAAIQAQLRTMQATPV